MSCQLPTNSRAAVTASAVDPGGSYGHSEFSFLGAELASPDSSFLLLNQTHLRVVIIISSSQLKYYFRASL